MLATLHRWVFFFGVLVPIFGCVKSANQAAPSDPSATSQTFIAIDGSSTVFPLTQEVVMEMQFERPNALEVRTNFSGTGGGFQKFCAGETDINNASRPILKDEMAACKANGIQYIELPVAFDALTIVVHADNDWMENITVDELRRIWEPAAEGKVVRWSQVRPGLPDRPLKLYGAGKDSGTFDYFTEAIVGETGASRNDYTASENDYELLRKIRRDPDALGYFGYAYYEESGNTLKALPVISGAGAVLPSVETVKDGTYQPLARPLFIYVNANSVQTKPEVQEFVEYYLANAWLLAKSVGYVPLPGEAYSIALEHLNNNRVGTVFDGQPQTNLTIDELLQKEAAF